MDRYYISWAAARVNAGLTLDNVTSILKVSKNTLINWEKYRSEPTISQAKILCDLYGVPADMVDTNGLKRGFLCSKNQIKFDGKEAE